MTTRLILISLPVQIGEDRDETGEVVEFYVPVLISPDGPNEDEADGWVNTLDEITTAKIGRLENALIGLGIARKIDAAAVKLAREQFDREQGEGEVP